jgi:hypothetical protein
MKLSFLILLVLLIQSDLLSQQTDYSEYGRLYRFELNNAPFPAPARENGHTYRDEFYPKETHYNDSTVLVFVPDYSKLRNRLDMVVYFHGWNNNVDTVLSQFNLIEQFHASGRQAILVMPEGPKNAPDSFGGKLEEAWRFRLFIDEVLDKLHKEITRISKFTPGNITLAGHSGAYRVISYILLRGGLPRNINEVCLFDGLYGDIEKFSYWLDHYNGRFIDIYTPGGGTRWESENLMECLTAWGIPYALIETDDFTSEQLNNERIVFIKSSLGHNEVISTRDQFRIFLESSTPK